MPVAPPVRWVSAPLRLELVVAVPHAPRKSRPEPRTSGLLLDASFECFLGDLVTAIDPHLHGAIVIRFGSLDDRWGDHHRNDGSSGGYWTRRECNLCPSFSGLINSEVDGLNGIRRRDD